MEDKIRTKATISVGGEPEEDWGQIGERVGRRVKIRLDKWARAVHCSSEVLGQQDRDGARGEQAYDS